MAKPRINCLIVIVYSFWIPPMHRNGRTPFLIEHRAVTQLNELSLALLIQLPCSIQLYYNTKEGLCQICREPASAEPILQEDRINPAGGTIWGFRGPPVKSGSAVKISKKEQNKSKKALDYRTIPPYNVQALRVVRGEEDEEINLGGHPCFYVD